MTEKDFYGTPERARRLVRATGVERDALMSGYAFLDMLAEKATIERPLVPMLEFLTHKLGHCVPLPDRVDRSWKGWMDTAIERFREAGSRTEESSGSDDYGE